MATIRERLVYAIDVVTDRAQTGFKGFRQSVSEADGAVGKFKAGASSAMSTVQANAGNLALVGGAALVAFGTKSVKAFQDTAIAAGKFSDATGLAVEDASRLAEVAGDVGVSASSIEGAIVRMNQAAGKGDLAELGVEIQRTADGATDVNATFLETIRVLNGIKDPTERALAAQKIFGRGYKEVAEIIFDSADNVAAKLGQVSEAKVIDQDELRKAREFRESMDNLNDALQDIQLAAGEALVPMLGDLADIVVLARDAQVALEDMIPGEETGLFSRGAIPLAVDALKDLKDAIDGGSEAGGTFRGVIDGLLPEINESGKIVRQLGDEAEETADAVGVALPDALRDFHSEAARARAAADEFGEALEEALARKAEESADRFDAAIDRVLGKIDEAFEAVSGRLEQQDILADIADGWDEIAEAQKEAAEGGEKEQRDLERAIRDQRREAENLLRTINNLPANKVIELATRIETGSLGELETIIANLSAGITVPVNFNTQPGFTGVNGVFSPTQATADIRGVMAPQQFAVPSGPIVTNIYPVGTTPTSANQDLTTFYRRNGITRS